MGWGLWKARARWTQVYLSKMRVSKTADDAPFIFCVIFRYKYALCFAAFGLQFVGMHLGCRL